MCVWTQNALTDHHWYVSNSTMEHCAVTAVSLVTVRTKYNHNSASPRRSSYQPPRTRFTLPRYPSMGDGRQGVTVWARRACRRTTESPWLGLETSDGHTRGPWRCHCGHPPFIVTKVYYYLFRDNKCAIYIQHAFDFISVLTKSEKKFSK